MGAAFYNAMVGSFANSSARSILRLLALPFALVVLAVGATSASAADPFQLATDGEQPDVAVDSSGTGHFVWRTSVGTVRRDVLYCRVPAGTRACVGGVTKLEPPAPFGQINDFDGPSVITTDTPGEVIVTTSRCCQMNPALNNSDTSVYVFRSTDGGQNFSAARAAGTLQHTWVSEGGHKNRNGVGDTIFAVASVFADIEFQAIPKSTGSQTAKVQLNLNGVDGFATDVAPFAGRPYVVVNDVFSDDTYLIRGPVSSNPTVLNNAANWTDQPVHIGKTDSPKLSAGPGGLFLISAGSDNARRIETRSYDLASNSFSAPSVVTANSGDIFSGTQLKQDDSGGLHSLWRGGNANYSGLDYARTSSGSWGVLGSIVRDTRSLSDRTGYGAPSFDVGGAANGGFAVWTKSSGTGSMRVEAGPLEPLPSLDPVAQQFDPRRDCAANPSDQRCKSLAQSCQAAAASGAQIPAGCDSLAALCRQNPSLSFCSTINCVATSGTGGVVNPRVSAKPLKVKRKRGKKAKTNSRKLVLATTHSVQSVQVQAVAAKGKKPAVLAKATVRSLTSKKRVAITLKLTKAGKKQLKRKKSIRYKLRASYKFTNSRRVPAYCGFGSSVSFADSRVQTVRTGVIKRKG